MAAAIVDGGKRIAIRRTSLLDDRVSIAALSSSTMMSDSLNTIRATPEASMPSAIRVAVSFVRYVTV